MTGISDEEAAFKWKQLADKRGMIAAYTTKELPGNQLTVQIQQGTASKPIPMKIVKPGYSKAYFEPNMFQTINELIGLYSHIFWSWLVVGRQVEAYMGTHIYCFFTLCHVDSG